MNGKLVAAFLASLLAASLAQAQTTYRWVDPATGRTMFSDQPPPSSARQVVRRQAPATDERQEPFAARAAAEKFPVRLYTSADCLEQCAKARALLNGRGVPFQERMVQGNPADLDELKKLTGGEAFVPVILVGRQSVKGFEPAGWNNLLDLAGYPKSAPFGHRPAAVPLAAPPSADNPQAMPPPAAEEGDAQ